VTWNGNSRATTFVSSTQLSATILASDIATTGNATLNVINPAPSSLGSNAMAFVINAAPAPAPAPTISSLSPSSAIAGEVQFTLTVNGTNFVSGSTVNFNGNARATTFVSATQLTAAILASDLATAGTFNVTVTNLAPGGGTSNAVTFAVNNPAPAITSLSPSSAIAGGPQFTLMVKGLHFFPDSVVTWNGSARATTFLSSIQLSATILASDIATAGTVNVAVLNPPNSVSNVFAFGINGAGTPRFASTGDMIQARAAHTATLLPNGKVLVVDGAQLERCCDVLDPIGSAEVFDPSLGSFASTGVPSEMREFHTATLLSNGKVLITGGNVGAFLTPTSTAELYDPAAGTFVRTGSMAVGRSGHTASLLADGRVLIAGGSPAGAPTAEIYDPGTSTFGATGTLSIARTGHTATVLPSGKVLIIGGQNDTGALKTSEIYDPTTSSFTPTGSMAAPRVGHTATSLPNGKVLVAGGASTQALEPGGFGGRGVTTAELYDPLTDVFVSTASMATERVFHTATLLPNGALLILGGFIDYSFSAGYESYNSAEIYDPAAASFTSTAPMSTGRFGHTATLLPDRSVLVTGGIGGDLALSSAEVFK
jgi:hypothetical protein